MVNQKQPKSPIPHHSKSYEEALLEDEDSSPLIADISEILGVYSFKLLNGYNIEVRVTESQQKQFLVQLKSPSRTFWTVKGKRYPREIKLYKNKALENDTPLVNLELQHLKCCQFFVLPFSPLCLTLDQRPVIDCLNINPPWIILKGRKPPKALTFGGEDRVSEKGKANLREVVPSRVRRHKFLTNNLTGYSYISKRSSFSSSSEDNFETDTDRTLTTPSSGNKLDIKKCVLYSSYIILTELFTLALFIVNALGCTDIDSCNGSYTSVELTCMSVGVFTCLILIGMKLVYFLVVSLCRQRRYYRRSVFCFLNIAVLILNAYTASSLPPLTNCWSSHQRGLLGVVILLTIFDFVHLCCERP